MFHREKRGAFYHLGGGRSDPSTVHVCVRLSVCAMVLLNPDDAVHALNMDTSSNPSSKPTSDVHIKVVKLKDAILGITNLHKWPTSHLRELKICNPELHILEVHIRPGLHGFMLVE